MHCKLSQKLTVLAQKVDPDPLCAYPIHVSTRLFIVTYLETGKLYDLLHFFIATSRFKGGKNQPTDPPNFQA